MSIFDDIRKDAEAGTKGPWVIAGHVETRNGGYWEIKSEKYPFGFCSVDNFGNECESNARRIARVPDLERIALAAEKLEKAAELVTSDCAPTAWDWKRYSAARDAFRAAVEEAA